MTPSSSLSPEERRSFCREIRRIGNRNGLLLLGCLFLNNLLVFAVSWVLSRIIPSGKDPTLLQSLLTIGSFAAQYLLVVPLLLCLNKIGNTSRIPLQKPTLSAGQTAKWCLIAFGCTYAVNYLFQLLSVLLQLLGIGLATPDLVLQPTLLDNITTLVFFGLFAPIFEELLFRGALLGNLRNQGEWFAVIMVGIMFGLLHLNLQQFVYATTLGIFAGFLRLKANSVYPAILAHFSLNSIGAVQSVLLSYVSDSTLSLSAVWGTAQAIPLLTAFLLSGVCFVLCIVGLVLFSRELLHSQETGTFRLENGCPQLTIREKTAAYLTAPGTLVFLLLSLLLTLQNSICF